MVGQAQGQGARTSEELASTRRERASIVAVLPSRDKGSCETLASHEPTLWTAMLYFAYGSNMSSRRLRARVPGARARGRGWLEDKRLVCNKPSKDGSGKANLVDAAGAVVWGVLYEIEEPDWPSLDRYEPDYSRVGCEVNIAADRRALAQVYIWIGRGPDIPLLDWYREHLLEGAREHGLPPDHIRSLEEL